MHQRVKVLLRRVLFSSIIFISSFLIGTFGLIYLENYNFWDAFYMTVITISTVGFGEIKPLSSEGRIFISFFIIYNIFVLAYSLSALAAYIFEGELRNLLNTYSHNRKIKSMKNHIIVCGFGRYGRSVCYELAKAKKMFVVIDTNPLKISEAEKLGYSVIEGSAMEDHILLQAGIRNAWKLICCLPKGADNVYITLTAREINPHITIIARAEEDTDEKKLMIAGANYVVKPNFVSALFISRLVQSPELAGFMQMMLGVSSTTDSFLKTVNFLELKNEYKNKTFQELDIQNRTGVMVLGLYDKIQQHYIVNPPLNTIVHEDLTLIVMGKQEQIQLLHQTYCNSVL